MPSYAACVRTSAPSAVRVDVNRLAGIGANLVIAAEDFYRRAEGADKLIDPVEAFDLEPGGALAGLFVDLATHRAVEISDLISLVKQKATAPFWSSPRGNSHRIKAGPPNGALAIIWRRRRSLGNISC
jgi:hypothetical protein